MRPNTTSGRHSRLISAQYYEVPVAIFALRPVVMVGTGLFLNRSALTESLPSILNNGDID